MPRSMINPAPVTVRKVISEGGKNWLFVYLNENVSRVEVNDPDGNSHIEYEYDSLQVCVPLPTTSVNLWAAEHHARNQDTLKKKLRLELIDEENLRLALKTAMSKAGIVNRVDRVIQYVGPIPVDVAKERNWAEALCIVVAPKDVSGLQTEIVGEYTQLLDIGSYRLWAANAPVDTLLDLHAELWAMQPTQTLGVLAVVREFGESFMPWAVTNATGATVQEMAARRDRISGYLDSLGHDTTLLGEATNEHEMMEGIVDALGYAMSQLWGILLR